MLEYIKIDNYFDDLLFQTLRGGLTHEQIEKGRRYEQFEQVTEWRLKYGYKFNIYGNDHLINGKPHFHFDNKEQNISCKVDFEGNILENEGSEIVSTKVIKELKYFLSEEHIQKRIIEMWNEKNPKLSVEFRIKRLS